MEFLLSEIEIPILDRLDENTVQLWYIKGHHRYVYPTKIAAEKAARRAYPDLSADVRYSLIYYRECRV